MKRIISAVIAVIIACLCFSGCGKESLIEPVSGEIIENEKSYTVNFVIANKTGGKIEELSATIITYSNNDNVADEKEVVYPLAVEDGKNATLSLNTEKKCLSAKVTAYSYKTENGKTVNGKFDNDFVAYVKKNSTSEKTRERLADDMIREIKNQFLEKGFMATGVYDTEKKELTIVSKYSKDYDVCAALYEQEPDMWKSLEDGIVQMSQTCYDEFKDNNFDDVSVNVGVVSNDEELMFSATNGNLKITLDSQ